MIRSLAKSLVAGLANKIAGRLVHDWQPLARDEWRHLRLHFSQYGEDIIADSILSSVQNGRYVDVGAFDPIHFSNTHLLHRRGWRGVNIDLDESKIAAFRRTRPDDVSVVAAVGGSRARAWVHEYAMSVLNRVTFDPEGDKRAENGDLPVRTREVDVRPLDEILGSNGVAEPIDYLNIDCEGFEAEVMRGFSFTRWRPRLVSLEVLDESRGAVLADLMRSHGYREVARTCITVFYAPVSGQ